MEKPYFLLIVLQKNDEKSGNMKPIAIFWSRFLQNSGGWNLSNKTSFK